jgi:Ca2+/Na+ antiporter
MGLLSLVSGITAHDALRLLLGLLILAVLALFIILRRRRRRLNMLAGQASEKDQNHHA